MAPGYLFRRESWSAILTLGALVSGGIATIAFILCATVGAPHNPDSCITMVWATAVGLLNQDLLVPLVLVSNLHAKQYTCNRAPMVSNGHTE